ncbi:lytic murein transglycosylase [Rhodovulum strictum]|uniref:Lytic murein transglycosylase n=1 Tax=Rhodovulum strictum TaxID=58314 RepID=A0A844BAA2_9RHOB|nr:lytic murein transglycosylase [Rhodovulum strictum]MRH19598.1 lytic murein transglycosylase [Rhodovulum strictum]
MPFSPARAAALVPFLCALTTTAPALALETSPRPNPRPALTEAGTQARPVLVKEAALDQVQLSTANIGFQRWIEGFRARALAQGIAPAVFDRAFQGVQYNADVIGRDRNQAEFTRTIWDYLDSAASETRVANGREALERHRALLERIEARFGVDKEVVVAIWGLESAYGTFRGTTPIIEALATLAFDGRRGAFFEDQLIAALRIVQAGDTDARNMTGSWAGAMGHTQFIPTSYLDYAVDFTGDGRRDIWGDDPADALASTAAYLARFGWQRGQPWGGEVQLPRDFDYRLADRSVRRMPSDWAALGVRDMAGRAVPEHGRASILLPAGARGAAFMVFDNFAVIGRYNTADAYVIGVGHLSDRIRGGGPIRSAWPREDRALVFAERQELQERLTRAGFDTKGVDGRIGPNTIAAVRAFQHAAGMIPDGYASLDLLNRLR